jgi:hypothetical protein
MARGNEFHIVLDFSAPSGPPSDAIFGLPPVVQSVKSSLAKP